jgi:hypothetical protein
VASFLVSGSCSIALIGNHQIASFCIKNHPNIAILKYLNSKIITLNHVVDILTGDKMLKAAKNRARGQQEISAVVMQLIYH